MEFRYHIVKDEDSLKKLVELFKKGWKRGDAYDLQDGIGLILIKEAETKLAKASILS